MGPRDDRELVFPSTGGEMAALMRDKRWEETPLGPVERWSGALRAAVRLLLTSRFSMWMGWGDDLTFLYNNAYRADTLGTKHPWALGQPAREVWREIWPEVAPRIARVLGEGRATWDESLMLILERSGYREESYHTFSYSPLYEDDGRIRGVFCVVTEDTGRVISERRVGLLGKLASRIAGAKTTAAVHAGFERALALDARDLPFTLTYRLDVGDRMARLVSHTGFTPGEAAGFATFARDAATPWPLRALADTGRSVEIELPERAWPAGPWSTPPTLAFAVPIARQGQVHPAGVFIAGLNPHRRFDDAYREFVTLLVGQLAAGLANAEAYDAERRRAESLAELDRAKTVFFSNVSHEFRTPLTLMLGPLGGLLADPDVPPAFRDEIATIHRNGLRLLKLVNTMLDFSRIEAGRATAQFAPTDLAELTSDLASVFRAATDRAGLRLTVDCPPLDVQVRVDRDMWEKIVLNLVSNAFKFTLQGEIAIALVRRGDRVELTVRDTGCGIPPHELGRVFERFHRVEGTAGRTHEGTGIGLALVQELVRLHGGTIGVASQLGRGTTFTVAIPIGAEGVAAVPAERVAIHRRPEPSAFVEEALRWLSDAPGGAPAAAPGEHGDRVVVADDNADMRDYLRRLLGQRWQVETCASGREALAAIRSRRPAVVVTDVMMPELDGFGLLAELRGDPELSDLPVIVLSARAGEEARIEGLQAGATEYLVKPFSSRELVARGESAVMAAQLRAVEQANLSELENARRDAETANRAKDEFLAMLGHELRNPLAPIMTALELMRLRPGVGAERERAVIERQVQHLVGLVDDLLDVARITRGKVELRHEPVAIADVVARSIEVVSPLLEERRHVLTVDVAAGVIVLGDPARLAQVVSNLLTNAAKYTPPGGRIAVRGRCEGERAVISVTDNGIGIEPGMLRRVFEPFAQASQAIDRARGGLGLGLAIVDNLVKLHHGTVIAQSDGPGCGSEMIVSLPLLAGATVARSATRPVHAASGAEARVLIIDDNVDGALLLAEVLAAAGYDTLAAHDGPSALQTVARFRPQVAVVDLGLPVMDGFELARLLLAEPAPGRPKLVALTGYGQAEDRARTAAAGFDAHLVKPVDIEQLRGVIERLLSRTAA